MQPFNVIIRGVEDPALGPLLSQLAEAGHPDPEIQPISASDATTVTPAAVKTGTIEGDLPTEWTKVRALKDQSYRWPNHDEHYTEYVVYGATTQREGNMHIALGYAPRFNTWGRDREYVVAFLTSGAPQVPLAEFLETDDYAETGEMIAVIRGRDGSRKMYGPTDSLPDIYSAAFNVVTYRDYIKASGSWNRAAVLAHRDDHATMLNHALVQARRRGDL